MPLPWVGIFFLIYFCFFSVSFFVNYFFISDYQLMKKMVLKDSVKMPW